MIMNAHFEKISYEQYVKDRLEYLDYGTNKEYLSANGVFDKDIDNKWSRLAENSGVFKFKDEIKIGSTYEAALLQLFSKEYDGIKLPERSSVLSLGYDFVIPFNIDHTFSYKTKPLVIPTGIRCVYDLESIDATTFSGLFLYPRSSTGIKKGLSLANGVAVIEPDYFLAKNEGHLLIALVHNNNVDDSEVEVPLFHAGDRFAQGVFFPVGVTMEDADDINNRDRSIGSRTGGIGSTGN